jgi:hypothetical protein
VRVVYPSIDRTRESTVAQQLWRSDDVLSQFSLSNGRVVAYDIEYIPTLDDTNTTRRPLGRLKRERHDQQLLKRVYGDTVHQLEFTVFVLNEDDALIKRDLSLISPSVLYVLPAIASLFVPYFPCLFFVIPRSKKDFIQRAKEKGGSEFSLQGDLNSGKRPYEKRTNLHIPYHGYRMVKPITPTLL